MATTTIGTTHGAAQDVVTIKDLLSRAAFTAVSAAERAVETVRDANRKRRTAMRLRNLSNEMLDDIGLSRADIDRISYDR